MMLSDREYAFVARQRIGHLATADAAANPHVVPVCFALDEDTLYTALDEKPKQGRRPRRLKNIEINPSVTFLTDRYDDDWTRLGWVMMRGRAGIVEGGEDFEHGCTLLARRYAQYVRMTLGPVIVVRILHVRSWGNLDA